MKKFTGEKTDAVIITILLTPVAYGFAFLLGTFLVNIFLSGFYFGEYGNIWVVSSLNTFLYFIIIYLFSLHNKDSYLARYLFYTASVISLVILIPGLLGVTMAPMSLLVTVPALVVIIWLVTYRLKRSPQKRSSHSQ